MATDTEIKPAAGPLGVEIATAHTNPFEPIFDGLLRPNDETLATRGQGKGLKIYDELERDPHAYAVLQKRKLAVVGREWALEPASSALRDKKAAALVEAQLKRLPFDKICMDLLDATLKGYAVAEPIWEISAGEVRPGRILARQQRRFVFDADARLRLLTLTEQVHGEPVPERKFIVHRFGDKDGNPYGLGLGTRLFWPVFFKRQGIQFWLTFIDKFASPTAIGKYPAGSGPEVRNKLLGALQAIAREACVTVPIGMEVSLLEAQRSGATQTYEGLCRYMDEEISKAVLGEIHTTGGGASGLGSGRDETANSVRLELTKADADLLAGTLNETLIRWICAFNCPGANPPRLWWDVSEPEDLKARAERDKTLTDMGLEPDDDYIAETYPGWRRKAAPSTGGAQRPNALAEFAERGGKPPERDAADDLADALETAAAPALTALLSPIERLVQGADSLEAIRDGLDKLFPDIDETELAKLLREAMATAWLTGRFDVQAGL